MTAPPLSATPAPRVYRRLIEVYPDAVVTGDRIMVGGIWRTIDHWALGAPEFPGRLYIVFRPLYGTVPYLIAMPTDLVSVWRACAPPREVTS